MKTFQNFILLFLLAVISSCTGAYDEDITNVLKNKNTEKTIAITGMITSDYKQQTIFVSHSMDFCELYVSNNDSKKAKDILLHRRVGGAKVSVEVAGKKYEFKEIHTTGHLYRPRENDWPEDIPYDEIYYESVDSFAGIPNQEHRLVVEVEGKTYTATDVMPQVSDFSFTEKSPLCREVVNHIDYYDTTTNYPEYLFGQQEAYVMGFNPIQIYTVEQGNYDEEFYHYRHLSFCYSFRQLAAPQLMGAVGDVRFVEVCPSPSSYDDTKLTDTIVVTKMSCSPAYEYYLYCLFQNYYGNDFDFGIILSNLPTNISNGGVGFFSACDIKRKIFSKKKLTQLAESIGNIIEY